MCMCLLTCMHTVKCMEWKCVALPTKHDRACIHKDNTSICCAMHEHMYVQEQEEMADVLN